MPWLARFHAGAFGGVRMAGLFGTATDDDGTAAPETGLGVVAPPPEMESAAEGAEYVT